MCVRVGGGGGVWCAWPIMPSSGSCPPGNQISAHTNMGYGDSLNRTLGHCLSVDNRIQHYRKERLRYFLPFTSHLPLPFRASSQNLELLPA